MEDRREEIFWSDEYVLYLAWGTGFMNVRIYQNSSNGTL